MIVRVMRPEQPGGPWMIYAPGLKPSFHPETAKMARFMETPEGYFYAKPLDNGGWDLGEPAPPQPW